MIVAAGLVFTMQVGFCALEAGFVRARNAINVAAKNLVDFCVAGAVFWAFGFALMFGAAPDLSSRNTGWAAAFFLFRSEEHTSELQSLMRISYAVFCLKKKKRKDKIDEITPIERRHESLQLN